MVVLPRPGRSGKKNEPVRPGYHLSDYFQVVRRQTQLFQSFDAPLSVQNSYHHLFSEKEGKVGNAEIYVSAFYAGFKPAVLRFFFSSIFMSGQNFILETTASMDREGQDNAGVHDAIHPILIFTLSETASMWISEALPSRGVP